MCNIKLDSTAQNPDAGAEARFALPFENLNIQLINLEKRDGKNLSLTTKGLQNVEKTGMLFLLCYSRVNNLKMKTNYLR